MIKKWNSYKEALQGWCETNPKSNGKYKVLVCMAPMEPEYPILETMEDTDTYREGHWLNYRQFVLGYKVILEA